MSARKVSAQFAAYTYFTSRNGEAATAEALRFARRNWRAFLGCAPEGLGRLLLRIAEGRGKRRPVAVAGAGA